MLTRLGVALFTSASMAIALSAQQPGPAPPARPDPPEITRMIDQLRTAAGPRWAYAVHFWCEEPRPNRPDDPPIPPAKIFDNVYAIGNAGTTVYVIRTSAGLLMIDALGGGEAQATEAQIASQLLPGFQKLGLDPAQVKVILVTHGHADHYGGSAYFEEHFHSKVYVSAADWNLMQNPPARGGRGPAGPPTPLPKEHVDIKDGEPIVLGDLRLIPVAVPGHTPGSMGFIFPVRDNGTVHTAALYGGAWLTPQILSNEALETFLTSVIRFKGETARARVDVLLQNHMLMDPIQPKIDAIGVRKKGDANPFVVGTAEYQKFLDVMEGCTRVNIARRRPAPDQPARAGAATGAPPQAAGRAAGPGYLKLFDSNRPFEAHDLAGIWSPNANAFGGGGRCRDCGDRGFSFEWPEFTPAGQAVFDKNVPSYGRAKDSDEAKAHPEEHIGRRRAQPPALGNDTYGTCNPMGMPRAILYPDPVEFIVLPDRIYQHFQWGYGLRTIWTDGRKLPAPDDIDIPRWWGYATGRWDGNALIVDSTGYDERTWVDYFGYPHSDQMVLQERYTRINYDTLELKMTVTDPKFYRKPWTSETKRMHLLPKDFIQSSGWASLLEDLCAPANELEFNRVIRDPAGTGKPAVAPTRGNGK